jgi:hypothetical protein
MRIDKIGLSSTRLGPSGALGDERVGAYLAFARDREMAAIGAGLPNPLRESDGPFTTPPRGSVR